MVRGCALIDSRLDTAKICSDGRVHVDHAQLPVVLGEKKRFYTAWVNNGPWVASELGPLIPQQRTCSDYCGISVWCPTAEAIQTIQPEPIMPRRQPGRRLRH